MLLLIIHCEVLSGKNGISVLVLNENNKWATVIFIVSLLCNRSCVFTGWGLYIALKIYTIVSATYELRLSSNIRKFPFANQKRKKKANNQSQQPKPTTNKEKTLVGTSAGKIFSSLNFLGPRSCFRKREFRH